jgi:PAS domain S-box-containing protein
VDVAARLTALRRYDGLDDQVAETLANLTRLASQVCDTPISVVSLVDTDRQVFRAARGVDTDGTSRADAFCAHAILSPESVLVVGDTRADPRFADNPLVTGAPELRFYAGAPLVAPGGHAIGTLCVIDTRPRAITPLQVEILRALAHQAMAQLELARQAVAMNRLLAEEQRTSRELREKGAMLEAIMDTSVAAIIQVDTAGQIVYANPQGEAVLGLTREALLGRCYDSPGWRHTAPDGSDWPDEAQPFRRIMATGEPVTQVEHAIEWPDGRRRQLSVNGAPIRDESGAIASLVFCVSDVTERHRTEEARLRLEAQLEQARRMEALGTLAGGVAHDFNNLLTVILGNLELARSEIEDGRADALLGDAFTASSRARDLVDQILAFSRRHSVSRATIVLGELVTEVTRLLRAIIPPGIELRTELSPGVPAVLASATQLHQALLNLCVNASRAIPSGRGRITVSLAPARLADGEVVGLRAGSYACLEVRDTGTGMDEATRARIFDPFFTTRAAGEGTGLGLAVVDGVVRNHDGAVTVESTLAVGTTFRVFLPATTATVDAVQPTTTLPADPTTPRGRILFVDDERLLVRIGVRALESHGHTVEGHVDPIEALTSLAVHPDDFDLVVTDLNMPAVTGLQVLEEVRRLKPCMPVIVASGFMTDDMRARLTMASATGLLHKPHLPAELRDAVEAALLAHPPTH